MDDGRVLILGARAIHQLLFDQDTLILESVKEAYMLHAAGETSLPHSAFLRFPNDRRNRIIALPAYLGGDFNLAGLKWISSFPANIERGLDRASGVIILNSLQTGRPRAIMEGSIISKKRTAASAALAALTLHEGGSVADVGAIGCGPINFETIRFLLRLKPEIERLIIFDLAQDRAEQFAIQCRRISEKIKVKIASEVKTVLKTCSLISIATTAAKPHLFDLAEFSPGGVILHLSLRDLSPEIILSCDNIVDDIDHVCRAETSIHLTEKMVGNRHFIRCTLGDVLRRTVQPRRDDRSIAVFSPFGLGILDLALASVVSNLADEQCGGSPMDSFLPGAFGESP
jgi:2,3-diaminopropionate biosynthesis protein SbnB